MKIILARHGETPWNAEGRYQGQIDIPLSPVGEGQATALGQRLKDVRIDRAVAYANARTVFGKPLAVNQAVQWPLVELQTEAEMVRGLVRKTAWELDRVPHLEISDKVSMCNYRANRFCCDAADRAMQVHGGIGYSRHKPFEHIYRHHRRYRITEGADEIQMRRVAGYLFGFMSGKAPKGVQSS